MRLSPVLALLFIFIPDEVGGTEVRGCPPQCSCHLQRSYYSLVGPYDQVNVLCNVYAANRGADLSTAPDLAALQSHNRSVLLSVEQMAFTRLDYSSFANQRIVSLKLLNNPSLLSIHPSIFLRLRQSLEQLTIMNHDSLATLPLPAIAELGNLKELSIQLKVPLHHPPEFRIAKLRSLKSLTLQGPQFFDVVEQVHELRQLEHLSLIDVGIGNPELRGMRLGDLPHLRTLNLASNFITVIPPFLRQLTSIEVFSLENNELRLTPNADVGLRYLPPFLQTFNLRFNYITSLACDLFNRETPLRYLKLDPRILCLLCEKDALTTARLKQTCSLNQTWFFTSPKIKVRHEVREMPVSPVGTVMTVGTVGGSRTYPAASTRRVATVPPRRTYPLVRNPRPEIARPWAPRIAPVIVRPSNIQKSPVRSTKEDSSTLTAVIHRGREPNRNPDGNARPNRIAHTYPSPSPSTEVTSTTTTTPSTTTSTTTTTIPPTAEAISDYEEYEYVLETAAPTVESNVAEDAAVSPSKTDYTGIPVYELKEANPLPTAQVQVDPTAQSPLSVVTRRPTEPGHPTTGHFVTSVITPIRQGTEKKIIRILPLTTIPTTTPAPTTTTTTTLPATPTTIPAPGSTTLETATEMSMTEVVMTEEVEKTVNVTEGEKKAPELVVTVRVVMPSARAADPQSLRSPTDPDYQYYEYLDTLG